MHSYFKTESEKLKQWQFSKIHSTVFSLYELVRTKHHSWVVSMPIRTLQSASPKFRSHSGDCPTWLQFLYIFSMHQIRARPFPSTSFTIHYSLITQPINKCTEDLPSSGMWHTVIAEYMVLCPTRQSSHGQCCKSLKFHNGYTVWRTNKIIK